MAYTLQQLQAMGAKPIEQSGSSYTIDQLQSMGATPISSSAPPQKPSLLKSFGKALLNAPAKIVATGIQAGTTAAALTGNEEANRASQRFAEEGVNLPFVGKTKPIGSPTEAAGVGLEAASFLPIARAPATGLQLLKSKNLAQGAIRGAKEGAGSGVLAGAGTEIQNPDATTGSIAKSTLTGGLVGGVAGGALGTTLAAIPALKASSAAARESAATDAIGRVLQGDTKDIETARKVLSDLDPSQIRTYADMRKQIGDRIETISKKHDEVLETNKTTKKLDDLNLTTTVGGQSLKENYVRQALDQLGQFYKKTNNAQGRLTVQNLLRKASEEGLTVKEINDIARLHGRELNAFNANGELASGLTKQAAENTRAGVKATVRDLFGNNLSKAADSEVTKLIRVRDLADDMVEKVNVLKQKIQGRSLGNRAGRLAEQALNLLTLGSSRGFVEAIVPRGQGFKTLNALDLEKQLTKNLRLIQKASKDDASEDAIVTALETFIKASGEAPERPKPVLDLRATRPKAPGAATPKKLPLANPPSLKLASPRPKGGVSSAGTPSSKPSTAANTSTGSAPNAKGGGSAPRTDTSAPFDGGIDERLAPLADKDGMVTVYRAAAKHPNDTYAKDTFFATNPDNANYYAQSWHKGDASDITTRSIKVPASMLKRGGSNDAWQLKEDYSVSSPSIPKELEGLAAEARKYKSAEEFQKAVAGNQRAYSEPYNEFTTSNRSSAKPYDYELYARVFGSSPEIKGDRVKVYRLTDNGRILPGDNVSIYDVSKISNKDTISKMGYGELLDDPSYKLVEEWIPKKDLYVTDAGTHLYAPDGTKSLADFFKKVKGD